MRLLVVEDEHKIANSIKKGLEMETYAVDVAYDGEEGYDLASSEDYDVIILDLMLPKMDGLSICQKLRSEDKHTPILILSAKGELADRIEGLNTGADDYLVKPFAFVELLARVRALSRRPKQAQGATLSYDNLSLNSLTYQVHREGKSLRLSKKEFALLEYLLRHPQQIVTKEQIINSVWNYEANVLPNTVEVYIGYLRKKVDNPFKGAKNLIQTIRGFGYRLGGE